MINKRVLSGIQPTGNLHLGNYLGAIKNFVAMQNEFQCFFMLADLHALTIKTDPILSHKISPSILDLDDSGNIGVKILTSENIVKFIPIFIVEDLEDGLWISGIPEKVDLIVKGHGFVEDGQKILAGLDSI